MRILHFLQIVRPDIGGPARAVVDLCAALARAGHEVTLASFDLSGRPDWRAGREPRARLVEPSRGIVRRCSGPQRDWFRARLAEHDVLHIHGPWEFANVQIAAAARRMGKPYIVSIRGMLDDWCMAQGALKKRAFLALAGRRMLERAAYVHLTAQAEFDQARKHFPKGRGVVIPNLLDLKPFERLPGPGAARTKFPALSDGRPSVLFLSRIHVKKGLEVLLRAAAILAERGVHLNVIIAGSGESGYVDSLKRLARDLGVEDRAHFVGLVVDQEKLSLYEAADLFVLPTSQENFGFVFVEALACGTPVVTTRGVDIWPELEGSGGAVIAEGSPRATAEAIEHLLRDRAGLGEMGRRGREWVFRDLDPARVLGRFEAMYEDAVRGSERRST